MSEKTEHRLNLPKAIDPLGGKAGPRTPFHPTLPAPGGVFLLCSVLLSSHYLLVPTWHFRFRWDQVKV